MTSWFPEITTLFVVICGLGCLALRRLTHLQTIFIKIVYFRIVVNLHILFVLFHCISIFFDNFLWGFEIKWIRKNHRLDTMFILKHILSLLVAMLHQSHLF